MSPHYQFGTQIPATKSCTNIWPWPTPAAQAPLSGVPQAPSHFLLWAQDSSAVVQTFPTHQITSHASKKVFPDHPVQEAPFSKDWVLWSVHLAFDQMLLHGPLPSNILKTPDFTLGVLSLRSCDRRKCAQDIFLSSKACSHCSLIMSYIKKHVNELLLTFCSVEKYSVLGSDWASGIFKIQIHKFYHLRLYLRSEEGQDFYNHSLTCLDV